MIAVIFEFEANPDRQAAYLDLAGEMGGLVKDVDGFIGIRRFRDLDDGNRILSLSFWRDEAAIERWRNTLDHRRAQAGGRGGIFLDYRLRVAEVLRDYGMNDRKEAPADSRAAHG